MEEGYNSPQNNNYLQEQNSDEGFGSEDDYDDQPEQKPPPKGVMTAAASALGGGFGDALGLAEDEPEDELTAMEREIAQGNVEGETQQDAKIKIRVFINMDEDDDNALNINLNDLFERTDLEKPFFVDVSKQPFYLLSFQDSNLRPFQLQRAHR